MPIDKILEETNTDKYYIEYCGFLSNHVSHVTVALYRLWASEAWIQKYVDWYVNRLETPRKDKEARGDIESLMGKHLSYYRILRHFQNLMKDKYKTVEELIASELPKYSLGLGSSALHSTIHTGYGYSARNVRGVCEGLAYLHHTNNPLVHTKPFPSREEIGKGTKSPVDLLQSLHEDKGLHDKMIKGIKKEPWVLIEGGFSVKMGYLLGVHGDHFMSLLSDMKLDVVRTDDREIDINDIGRKAVDIAMTAYVMAQRTNDFFMLHGVTSAWNVLQLLPFLTTAHALEIIEVYLIDLMATYVVQDCPQTVCGSESTINS